MPRTGCRGVKDRVFTVQRPDISPEWPAEERVFRSYLCRSDYAETYSNLILQEGNVTSHDVKQYQDPVSHEYLSHGSRRISCDAVRQAWEFAEVKGGYSIRRGNALGYGDRRMVTSARMSLAFSVMILNTNRALLRRLRLTLNS